MDVVIWEVCIRIEILLIVSGDFIWFCFYGRIIKVLIGLESWIFVWDDLYNLIIIVGDFERWVVSDDFVWCFVFVFGIKWIVISNVVSFFYEEFVGLKIFFFSYDDLVVGKGIFVKIWKYLVFVFNILGSDIFCWCWMFDLLIVFCDWCVEIEDRMMYCDLCFNWWI